MACNCNASILDSLPTEDWSSFTGFLSSSDEAERSSISVRDDVSFFLYFVISFFSKKGPIVCHLCAN